MQRFLKLTTALVPLGFMLPAHAADMATKAPVAPSFFSGYPSGSGFYFGANSALATGKANGVTTATINANAGSLVTQEGEVGLTVGYTWAYPGKPVWFGVEGTFDFSNINAQSAAFSGLSLGGPASLSQIAILGAPWGAVSSFIPSFGGTFPTLPVLPSGVTANNAGNVYAFLGAYEQDVSPNFGLGQGKEWLVGLTTGVGTRWLLSNSTALDIRFEYQAPTQSTCFGSAVTGGCVGLGSAYKVRTAVLF